MGLKPDFFNNIIRYCFYILFFLIPLVMTPWNYELFEYNKMMLVYGMTVVIVGAWIGKMISSGEIRIQRTPLDIPIVFYLISSCLSTYFSIERHTSIWGYYSRFHGGLMSTICYVLLYYAFVSNLTQNSNVKTQNHNLKIKTNQLTISNQQLTINCIYILLASAFLVTFYGVLEHLGIDSQYWIQDVKNRVFSTLGQPNWLGAFIDALIFIPLGLLLTKSFKKNPIAHFLLLTSYFTMYFCLIFTNSKSAILAFWVGLAVFGGLIIFIDSLRRTADRGNDQVRLWKTIGLISLISLLGYFAWGTRTYSYVNKVSAWLKILNSKQEVSLPPAQTGDKYVPFVSESSDIRKVVWKGAVDIWRHYPIFGSGIETFAYSYYNFRPKEHNLLSEWDFLYNKAHNEFLNIMATQGTVGIISYLLLISSFVFWIVKKIFNKQKLKYNLNSQLLITNYSLLPALLVGYLTILITNFFGFSVVVIGLLFFMLPAFAFVLSEGFKESQVYKINIANAIKFLHLRNFLFLILIFSFSFLIFNLVQMWRADYFFAQAQKYDEANYLVNALMDSQKSLEFNPREAIYHEELAQISSRLAAAYWQTDASQSGQLVQQLSDLAIQETSLMLQLNPVHLNFYKTGAKVYVYLANIDPLNLKKAIALLDNAGKLAPTDAKVFYNLGLLYKQDNNLAQAQQIWEKAVDLKPNYRQVRWELANLYLQTKQKVKAKEQLQFILDKIDQHDKETTEALKQLE